MRRGAADIQTAFCFFDIPAIRQARASARRFTQRRQRADALPCRPRAELDAEKAAQERRRGRRRERPEGAARQFNAAARPARSLFFEKIILHGLRFGKAAERQCRAGIDGLEARKDIEAQGVARRVGNGVGGILAPRLSALAQIRNQILFFHAQQRPPEIALALAHARRSRRARTAQQVHEHRLGLIAGVMGGGDAACPRRFFGAAQKGVAQAARGGFQALARQAGGGHVGALAQKGHAQPRAEIAAKLHIRDGRLAADAVLKMRRAHLHARFRKQSQQSHRVRAA